VLTLWGNKRTQLCDGLSRRDFLSVGTLGIAGLTLADLLRHRAQARSSGERDCKAVIMVYLNGGPSHIDTYDLKPDAPPQYRGEFKPIHTNVPGIDICEHLPLQAKIADKVALIRNFKTVDRFHLPDQLLTGFTKFFSFDRDTRPAFGSVLSKLYRGKDPVTPPYVTLNWYKSGFGTLLSDTAYLTSEHRPLDLGGTRQTQPVSINPVGGLGIDNLTLHPDVSRDRLEDRKALLNSFDSLRRDLDPKLPGMDRFTARALDMITSSKVRDAFDVSKEPDKTRQKYGRYTTWLQARRLVEAGVSVVTLKQGPENSADEWDTHQSNFSKLRERLPAYDQSVYALITDLYERGLDKDVAVVIWGEMGRTPLVNKDAGRDHWPQAGFVFVAGGGFKMGQVIGATSPRGEHPVGGHYDPQNVLATLYGLFGIDPETTLPDHSGRPMYLLDERDVVKELV
jgi:hypothetical protein